MPFLQKVHKLNTLYCIVFYDYNKDYFPNIFHESVV